MMDLAMTIQRSQRQNAWHYIRVNHAQFYVFQEKRVFKIAKLYLKPKQVDKLSFQTQM